MGGMDIADLLDTPGLNSDDLRFEDIIEDEFDEDYTIEFRVDNTVSLSSDEEMEEGTYSINGDVLTIISAEEEESITFIIKTLDGNSLVLTQQEELDFTETGISNTLRTQPIEIEVDLSFNRL
jgi:C4-type Zn-finger protein